LPLTAADDQLKRVSLLAPTGTAADLDRSLGGLDGKPLGRCRDLLGVYDLGTCTLSIDDLPGDPAAFGVIRVEVKQKRAQVPAAFFSTPERRRACEDYLARQVAKAVAELAPDGRERRPAGTLSIGALGQHILERTVLRVSDERVLARLAMRLPTKGERLVAGSAADLLLRQIPGLMERSVTVDALADGALRRHVSVVEDQENLRARLEGNGLVAFIANGAVLARQPDGSDLPLDRERRLEFRSPDRLKFTLNAPNWGAVMGMGVPLGVTVVVGGVQQGKSTLLEALQQGVYDHVPGDGRDRVLTVRNAVRVSAEPGRSVRQVDLSPFVSSLPGGHPPSSYDTDCAPKSLSQAVGLMEALEMGATALLIDEDTSAVGFLHRDARTQQLVSREHQSLIPLVEQAHLLYTELGVSTIVVASSPGDYLDAADTVIMMQDSCPLEVTSRARTIAAAMPNRRQPEVRRPAYRPQARQPLRETVPAAGEKIEVQTEGGRARWLRVGEEVVDLRCLGPLLEPSTAVALGYALQRLKTEYLDGTRNLPEALSMLELDLDRFGLELLCAQAGDTLPALSRPRMLDVGAVLNRLPSLRVVVEERVQ